MTSVVEEVEKNRFVYREDGHEGELVYRAENGRLILDHTEVPEELGGKGVGGQLVQAAVDRATAAGETVVPRCPFTRSWLERHPEQADRISIDWPNAE